MSYQQDILNGNIAGVSLHQDHTIGAFQVCALDGVLSAEDGEELTSLAQSLRYQRAEADRLDTRQRSMVAEFDIATVFQAGFVRRIVTCVRGLRGNQYLQPYRAYMNNNVYGDMSHAHHDSAPDDPTITAILYANTRWNKDWGGETIFYDLQGDSVACVLPKFGRLVIFDGEIEHKGATPARECYEERLTFVIKLRHVDQSDPNG